MFGGSGLGGRDRRAGGDVRPAVRLGDRPVPVVRQAGRGASTSTSTIAVEGHQITQARAVCHVADREILTVNAALGDRPFDRGWAVGDDARRRPAARRLSASGSTASTRRVDRRPRSTSGWRRVGRSTTLDGTPGDGQTLLWARIPEVIDGVDGAAARRARRLRADGRRPGPRDPRRRQQPRQHAAGRASWCRPSGCCSTSASHAVERGFGHGLVHMFAEDGTLLATASQSCIVRYWQGRRRDRLRHDVDMSLPVRPGMTVPLPGPLHTHRDQLAELADLGYTDIWSAEADGADAFTPLALAAAWEPRLRLGTAIVPAYTRSPALLRPERGVDGRRRTRAIRDRHRLVEQRDRRAMERRAVRRAVQEGPRRGALPP